MHRSYRIQQESCYVPTLLALLMLRTVVTVCFLGDEIDNWEPLVGALSIVKVRSKSVRSKAVTKVVSFHTVDAREVAGILFQKNGLRRFLG